MSAADRKVVYVGPDPSRLAISETLHTPIDDLSSTEDCTRDIISESLES